MKSPCVWCNDWKHVWVLEAWESHDDCNILGVFYRKVAVADKINEYLELSQLNKRSVFSATTEDIEVTRQKLREWWTDGSTKPFDHPTTIAHFYAKHRPIE